MSGLPPLYNCRCVIGFAEKPRARQTTYGGWIVQNGRSYATAMTLEQAYAKLVREDLCLRPAPSSYFVGVIR